MIADSVAGADFGLRRAGRLQQALAGEREEDEVVADVVEHDRHDHLVGAGAGLEDTRDAGPQGAGHHAGEDGERQVHDQRQVER